MDIKRGLKRLLVVGTGFWIICFSFITYENYKKLGGFDLFERYLIPLITLPLVLWILLYSGIWITSGFSNDKKKDETNE